MLIAHSEKAAAADVEHAHFPLGFVDKETLDMAHGLSALIDDGTTANILPKICQAQIAVP
jgi:hypothetical protein